MQMISSWSAPVECADVVILAGGASSRMERPKAFLPFDEREDFLTHILMMYRRAGWRVVLVLPSHLQAEYGVRNYPDQPDVVVINERAALGRMQSVRCGLSAVREDAHVMIQDIDRPFVTPELIEAMRHAHTTFGYTAPVYDEGPGHPILLSPHAAKELREDSSPTLRDALATFPCREVPWEDALCGSNINDPQDYALHFTELVD